MSQESHKVVYIAGRYRGQNALEVERHIRAASEVAERVWAAGLVALCPHMNSRLMECVTTDDHILAGTLELMRRCDAVLLVSNWTESEGARAEVVEAMRLGLPVLYAWGDGYYLHQLLDLLKRTPAGYRTHDQEPRSERWWGIDRRTHRIVEDVP